MTTVSGIADGNSFSERRMNGVQILAESGRRNLLKECLLNATGASLYAAINHKDREGNTVIHHAAHRNWPDIMALLCDLGADPGQENARGWTAAAIAAAQGHLCVLEEIIAVHGPDARKNPAIPTPLHRALSENRTDVAVWLMERGADPLLTCHTPHLSLANALHVAACAAPETLRLFLSQQYAPYFSHTAHSGANRLTVVAACAVFGREDTLAMLFTHGFSPNDRDENGNTLLHTLALAWPDQRADGSVRIEQRAAFLIRHGADTCGAFNALGETPVGMAVRCSGQALIRLLAEEGADINAGKTPPLHMAAMLNKVESAKTLLALGAKLQKHDIAGRTALDCARLYGRTEIIDLFSPLPVNAPAPNKRTPTP